MWLDVIFRLTIVNFVLLLKRHAVLLFFEPCGNCKIGSINNRCVKKIFVKKSQELLISRRLSSLPLHTWKMVTLSSHRNFSAQTDQVPHVCPVLGFSPPQVKRMLCAGRSPVFPSWLVEYCVCNSCSISSKLSHPEGACGRLGVSVQGSVCFFPPSLHSGSDAGSQHPSPLVCWGAQLGIAGQRSKGENDFWCWFPQGKALFLGAGTQQRGPCNCVSKNGPFTFFSLPQGCCSLIRIKPWFLF